MWSAELKTSNQAEKLIDTGFRVAPASAIVSDMPKLDAAPPTGVQDPQNDLIAYLEGIQRKDRSAFEAFYDLTVARIYSLALRITRQHETAEEVVSDVYLQVWQQAGRYETARGNVLAWLTVLCRSRALDTLRRSRPAATHEFNSNKTVSQACASQQSQDFIIAIEEHSAVHTALMKLDEQPRQLLALAYFRGYSHSELAKVTGLPLGTVKTQLRRTLITLKSLLSGDDSALGDAK